MSIDPSRGYLWRHRILECCGIVAFLSVLLFMLFQLSGVFAEHGLMLILNLFLGACLADAITGFVHWFADTWGTAEWPLVGGAFIRPFREHHENEKLITTHDFIETNGNNCIVSLPVLAMAWWIFDSESALNVWASSLLVLTSLWGFATNQFHKWAHMDHPPRLIQILQKSKLILPVNHHAVHHKAPFDKYYAITNGWTNWIAEKLGWYRFLEYCITVITGARPRDYILNIPPSRTIENSSL